MHECQRGKTLADVTLLMQLRIALGLNSGVVLKNFHWDALQVGADDSTFWMALLDLGYHLLVLDSSASCVPA